ncbi:MAG: hypothetical protein NW202_13305 [Nitrospira sp.]|nr:hypothetical protein [Nitrospira sp.]
MMYPQIPDWLGVLLFVILPIVGAVTVVVGGFYVVAWLIDHVRVIP